ncbi:MAG: pyruvate dehydrogenase [Candidatus Gerdarchaeota archaeon]|nr:MAG: pyruvate dehydrogenase [Candidatus Gerdarchaeota archaeon]
MISDEDLWLEEESWEVEDEDIDWDSDDFDEEW